MPPKKKHRHALHGLVPHNLPLKPKNVDEKLRKLYYSFGKSGAVSGIEPFWKSVKASEWGHQISRKQVVQWCSQNPTYFLFKSKRKNFPRNKVKFITHSNFHWTCDLWVLPKWSQYNDEIVYILVVCKYLGQFSMT